MHTAFSSSKTVFDAIITYFVISTCVTDCNIIKCIHDILPILHDVFDGMTSLTAKPQQTSCRTVCVGWLGCLEVSWVVCLSVYKENNKTEKNNISIRILQLFLHFISGISPKRALYVIILHCGDEFNGRGLGQSS